MIAPGGAAALGDGGGALGGAGAAGRPTSDGNGARGPDKIWPGLGAGGAGRAGILVEGRCGAAGIDGVRGGALCGGAGCDGAPGAPAAGRPGAAPGCASGGRIGSGRRIAGVSGGRAACVAGSVSSAAGTGAAESSSTSSAGSGRSSSTRSRSGGASTAACSSGAASSSRAGGSPSTPKCFRTRYATSSSIELECVFFSVTPKSGRRSIITFGLTSSSRASSLIRIFFIMQTADRLPLPPAHTTRHDCLQPTDTVKSFSGAQPRRCRRHLRMRTKIAEP
jgi:hypothetical protein